MLTTTLFRDLANILEHIDILRIGRYFKVLALASAYNYMIKLADERTKEHPEVIKVPQLRDMLLMHFLENADRHIDADKDSIFNERIIGSEQDLRSWQEAGFATKRTQANYDRRLEYWKAIYDERPYIKYSTQSSDPSKQSKKSSPSRVKDKQGNIVLYEQVISQRNARYANADTLIPFWLPLNYGTGFGSQSGYPSYQGLHFVEDAEAIIPQKLTLFLYYYEEYLNYIIGNYESAVDSLDSWSLRRITVGDEYISSFDLVKILV